MTRGGRTDTSLRLYLGWVTAEIIDFYYQQSYLYDQCIQKRYYLILKVKTLIAGVLFRSSNVQSAA